MAKRKTYQSEEYKARQENAPSQAAQARLGTSGGGKFSSGALGSSRNAPPRRTELANLPDDPEQLDEVAKARLAQFSPQMSVGPHHGTPQTVEVEDEASDKVEPKSTTKRVTKDKKD